MERSLTGLEGPWSHLASAAVPSSPPSPPSGSRSALRESPGGKFVKKTQKRRVTPPKSRTSPPVASAAAPTAPAVLPPMPLLPLPALGMDLNPEEPQYDMVPPGFNVPPRVNIAERSKMTAGEQWRDLFGRLKGPNREYTEPRPQLRDYQTLASTSRRAGRRREEAMAHFCCGVLHDNVREFDQAIRYYQQCLKQAMKAEDAQIQAIAYNSIGVALHRKGDFEHAIQYHRRHFKTSTGAGQIIALCNEGLAYRELGDVSNAEAHHRRALQLAMQFEDAGAESLAVGQLGLDRLRAGTKSRLAHGRRNLERHAELQASTLVAHARGFGLGASASPLRLSPSPPRGARGGPARADASPTSPLAHPRLAAAGASGTLSPPHATSPARSPPRQGRVRNVCRAYRQLGVLAAQRGDYEEALQHFEQSLDVASRSGDQESSNIDKCHIGVALGQYKLKEYLASLQRRPEGSAR